MPAVNELQNALFNNVMNIFNSLSFYSPIIICVSIVVFSMFTATIEKAFVFFVWIFIITFIRIIVFKGLSSGKEPVTEIPNICLTGLSELFIPKDVTYSTYILTFTMMYFITPMMMVSKQNNINAINYGVLAFFVAYIALDLFIKNTLSCIPGFFSTLVIGDVVSGMFLGGVIAGLIMYGSNLKSYLYINEVNTNKEVCTMPSKQQFKCRVFKDGTLIGNL
jgi:hypothetical protein